MERWKEIGGLPGITGCSGKLGLAQSAQRAVNMGKSWLTCIFQESDEGIRDVVANGGPPGIVGCSGKIYLS